MFLAAPRSRRESLFLSSALLAACFVVPPSCAGCFRLLHFRSPTQLALPPPPGPHLLRLRFCLRPLLLHHHHHHPFSPSPYFPLPHSHWPSSFSLDACTRRGGSPGTDRGRGGRKGRLAATPSSSTPPPPSLSLEPACPTFSRICNVQGWWRLLLGRSGLEGRGRERPTEKVE